VVISALCVALGAGAVGAQHPEKDQNKEQDRLAECGVVMNEVLDIPDNVPQEILDQAECVIAVPSMTKVR